MKWNVNDTLIRFLFLSFRFLSFLPHPKIEQTGAYTPYRIPYTVYCWLLVKTNNNRKTKLLLFPLDFDFFFFGSCVIFRSRTAYASSLLMRRYLYIWANYITNDECSRCKSAALKIKTSTWVHWYSHTYWTKNEKEKKKSLDSFEFPCVHSWRHPIFTYVMWNSYELSVMLGLNYNNSLICRHWKCVVSVEKVRRDIVFLKWKMENVVSQRQ